MMGVSRRQVAAGVVAAVCLPLGGCIHPTYRARVRLTVQARENGRVVNGSSVLEYSVIQAYKELLAQGAGAVARIQGEATVVDLGGGRLLVALLSKYFRPNGSPPGTTELESDPFDPYEIAVKRFGLVDKNTWDGVGRDSALDVIDGMSPRPSLELTTSEWPVMVTFDDPANPLTVRLLDPDKPAEGSGSDLTIEHVTMSFTSDPLFTEHVEGRFPWLGRLSREQHLDGETTDWGSNKSVAGALKAKEFISRLG